MNDKNFIEELRQKREEYGVTQTRLAVACGISREYYNRIEKGKQPLNDELREIIEKQIERFNPQEPLFLLIDYFRVRFPTTDALAIIRDVLQLKSNYMLYEDYGKYGYESKYVLGDINIMCSMQEHLGVLLELKGKGCRQMENQPLIAKMNRSICTNNGKSFGFWLRFSSFPTRYIGKTIFFFQSFFDN